MEEDFWSHLEDLRKRIIYSLLFFFIGGGAVYPFSDRIIEFLVQHVGKTYFFAPQEALFIRIKISLMMGLVAVLPLIIHQGYIFLKPALKVEERRYSAPLLFFLIIFFYGGIAVAYYIFIPYILRMLMSFQLEVMLPLISISRYIGFLLWIMAGFGVAFEMPVFFFLLTKLGIITTSVLLKQWKISVIVILIFASVITPTLDMVTMLIASFPLFLLYFISIFASFLANVGRNA